MISLTQSDIKISTHYSSVLEIADHLPEVTKQAVRQMINHFELTKKLTREEAYMLCSIAVDIRVRQIVDMLNYTVG